MNMIRKNRGFTLVELIVVIAILAILAGVAIPAYSGYITKAKDAAIIELDTVATAVQAARATDTEKLISIAVGADGTVTANPALDATQKADFKIFYGNDRADSSKLADTSYKNGTTWTATDPDDDGPKAAGWNAIAVSTDLT